MQASIVSGFPRARLLAFGVLLTALGACVGQDKPLTQCEPGVGDLSRTATVAPANC